MKVYHIEVVEDEGWYVGRVLDRPGVTTQGVNLDELVFMLRDAIELMWNEKNVQFELIVSPKIKGKAITPRDRHGARKSAGKRAKFAA
jgi:predicted RNase H-like HicB family nuclease